MKNDPLLSELRAWRRAAKRLSRALSRAVSNDPNRETIRAEALAHFHEIDAKYPRRELTNE
jgi:hypothetical protein